ncbi:TPA: DNA-binding protein [Streptococcus suis]|uniref:DNA-binding protein n=1 Tax=Streptococcus suis TaxID=1307 RepID=A0A0N0DNI0_STRSU|nr:DNA-binding protein [Streptococcus suis]AZR98434.1 DNA-binding protein [Streptococcus suis]KPA68386.1 DNA-binding protein [Streptococcus suis]MBO4126974.1 DNA-binding protein [Streptococcus suis]MBY4970509.1 DNA-binding protein [Streptococcus suis]MBY5017985.1 DNA-binding protein [Streptococcus suis]
MKKSSMYTHLLNREQAADYLGIDPKSFDKYFRADDRLKRFMIGKRERFTRSALMDFVSKKLV